MSSYNDFVLKERLEPTKGSMYGTATAHEVTHTHGCTRIFPFFENSIKWRSTARSFFQIIVCLTFLTSSLITRLIQKFMQIIFFVVLVLSIQVLQE